MSKKAKGKITLKKYGCPARMAFVGECVGVALVNRSPNDPHVCFLFIIKCKNYWIPDLIQIPAEAGFSSFWLNEMVDHMVLAQKWVRDNCEEDPNGWRFKTVEDHV